MERNKPPSELDIDSLNLADVWKEWKEAWELYRISSGLHEKDDAIQIATVQSILGTKARRVIKTLPNIPGDITQRTVEGILTALETYCVPRKNTTYERYVFRMTIQEDRSLDIFVTDLRRRAEYCDFGAIKDSLIRDQIVVGINDLKLRERLLREMDLTLEIVTHTMGTYNGLAFFTGGGEREGRATPFHVPGIVTNDPSHSPNSIRRLICEYLVTIYMYYAICLGTMSSLGKCPSVFSEAIFGNQNSLLLLRPIILSLATVHHESRHFSVHKTT